MQAFCGFSAVFLAFIIPYFDDFCTVYRMIGIVQFTLCKRDWIGWEKEIRIRLRCFLYRGTTKTFGNNAEYQIAWNRFIFSYASSYPYHFVDETQSPYTYLYVDNVDFHTVDFRIEKGNLRISQTLTFAVIREC